MVWVGCRTTTSMQADRHCSSRRSINSPHPSSPPCLRSAQPCDVGLGGVRGGEISLRQPQKTACQSSIQQQAQQPRHNIPRDKGASIVKATIRSCVTCIPVEIFLIITPTTIRIFGLYRTHDVST